MRSEHCSSFADLLLNSTRMSSVCTLSSNGILATDPPFPEPHFHIEVGRIQQAFKPGMHAQRCFVERHESH
jgi:hypothetical protein